MLHYMPRLLLLYATNSGNTTFVAETIGAAFTEHHLSMPIRNVGYAKPEEVLGRDLLLLGSPTWDNHVRGRYKEGQLQDQMAEYLNQIKSFKLHDMPMAVFGLGDSQFKYFCGATVLLQKFVTEVGGRLINQPLYIDGQPQQQTNFINSWARETIAAWRQPRA
jgi:flavodoxin I